MGFFFFFFKQSLAEEKMNGGRRKQCRAVGEGLLWGAVMKA